MVCVRCFNDLFGCICPDKLERIRKLRKIMAVKWCLKCDNHYRICKCEEPNFTAIVDNKDIGKGPHRMGDGSLIEITNER